MLVELTILIEQMMIMPSSIARLENTLAIDHENSHLLFRCYQRNMQKSHSMGMKSASKTWEAPMGLT